MSIGNRLFAVLSMGAVLVPIARAQGSTYVVDDGGGPGVHFTDLPPAIAAAVAGDVLVVRSGAYSAFTLSEGLSIVGEPGSVVDGGVVISNVPADESAVLAVLDFADLAVVNCTGAVAFDACAFSGVGPSTPLGRALIRVDQSADVRFHACPVIATQTSSAVSSAAAIIVAASRVELASCTITGAKGGNWPNARTGGSGLRCFAGSRVHVALSEVRGGDGGNGSHVYTANGASGGHAIDAFDDSETIVAGIASTVVMGGDVGNVQAYCCPPAYPGSGYAGDIGCSLRYSGAQILRGDGSSSQAILSAGSVLQAVPEDPTLEISGDPLPGALITVTLYGVPGTLGQLQQGAVLLVEDDGQSVIEKLTNRILHRPFGIVPANGVASRTYRVRANWTTGRLAVLQGLQRDSVTNALLERTNSVPLVVR